MRPYQANEDNTNRIGARDGSAIKVNDAIKHGNVKTVNDRRGGLL